LKVFHKIHFNNILPFYLPSSKRERSICLLENIKLDAGGWREDGSYRNISVALSWKRIEMPALALAEVNVTVFLRGS
jgi:hypothetical protein